MFDYYTLHALFAVIRLFLWFLILFLWIAPFLFEEINRLSGIDRLVYSWLGFGGVILLSVASLTILHIYDFFSIAITIFLIPLLRAIWLNRHLGVINYLEQYEVRVIREHVRFIESFKSFGHFFEGRKSNRIHSDSRFYHNIRFWAVFIVISVSFLLRIIPALQHAEPFSREWFFNLHHIKAIRLQDYFDGSINPAGLFAFISFIGMLTQVSPELILHVFGAVNSILLLLIIYWALKKILNDDDFIAPLFGTAIFGIIPTLFLPIDLNHQVEANMLMFSLCFGIPSIVSFALEREKMPEKMFFISMGIIATGLTNLFVLLMVVLPFIMISYFFRLFTLGLKSGFRVLIRIISSLIVVAIPYALYVYRYQMNWLDFIQQQLFSTSIYSNLTHLILPIDDLSQIYIVISALLLVVYGIIFLTKRNKSILAVVGFLFVFILISAIYIPDFHIGYNVIDIDQLNSFYTILTSVLFGIAFFTLVLIIRLPFKARPRISLILNGIVFIGIIAFMITKSGVGDFYQPASKTFPGSFYKAYYKIINDNVPNTYTVVAPDIDSTMARNRHGFMDYKYFLQNYPARDSVYYNTYYENVKERDKHNDLSNLFVFLEKKPYDEIEVGIMPDQQEVMPAMINWLNSYRTKKYRKVKLYFDSSDILVYEIVNNSSSSNVYNVLFHKNMEK